MAEELASYSMDSTKTSLVCGLTSGQPSQEPGLSIDKGKGFSSLVPQGLAKVPVVELSKAPTPITTYPILMTSPKPTRTLVVVFSSLLLTSETVLGLVIALELMTVRKAMSPFTVTMLP